MKHAELFINISQQWKGKMLDLKELKAEACEGTWKDWFIVDEPEETLEVSIFLDANRVRKLNVDSRFQKFKVTGIVDDTCLPQFRVCYLFRDGDPMQLQATHGYRRIVNYDRKVTIAEFIITR